MILENCTVEETNKKCKNELKQSIPDEIK